MGDLPRKNLQIRFVQIISSLSSRESSFIFYDKEDRTYDSVRTYVTVETIRENYIP